MPVLTLFERPVVSRCSRIGEPVAGMRGRYGCLRPSAVDRGATSFQPAAELPCCGARHFVLQHVAAGCRDCSPRTLIVALLLLSCWLAPASSSWASLRHSAIVKAVSTARCSVVNIHGRKTLPGDYDAVGAADSGNQVNGMGTGIIIDERGYILTNYHVVEGVKRIRATLSDGSTVIAELVANDPKTDLAIIKIPGEQRYPVIRTGTSEDLMPGETVVAVGNAYGYEHTVTQGIISALHRTVQVSDYQKYLDLIQTDASINPGNSGGPLLNIDGDMIGINVAVRVGAQGIGFAIPINEAMEVAANLLSAEHVSRVRHGATVQTAYTEHTSRVIVESVSEGSPADKAGLEAGDVIRRVADRQVFRRLDLERAVLGRTVGEEIVFEVDRDGQELELSVVLDESDGLRRSVKDLAWDQLGLQLSPISKNVFRKYHSRYRGGLKIVAVRDGSPAADNGLRRGDILVGMHKWETISEDNVAYILNSAEFKATQPFKFYILRGSDTLYGTMKIDLDD